MEKREEVDKAYSCLNKANDSELIFVLLERDIAAPDAIRAWCFERVRLGKNAVDDFQIREAMQIAEEMENRQA